MNKEWTIDIFTRNLKYYMKKFNNRIHFDRYRQLLEVIKNPYFPMVCGGSSNC